MNIPDSWVGTKRNQTQAPGEGEASGSKKKKRFKVPDAPCTAKEQCSKPQDPEREADDNLLHNQLYNELRCAIHTSGGGCTDQPAQLLSLESIISRQPYVKMMQSLFGAYDESCFSQVPPVKVVSKAWEEMYMREPQENERPCSMGINCECMFIDPALPFTCVEFRLPNEPLPNEQVREGEARRDDPVS